MATSDVLIACLAFYIVVNPASAWQLAESGLNESSYYVRHVSMHYSRVFFPMPTVVFPSRDVHANGDHSDCSRLQQAHWSQVDALNRLWVMDTGFPASKCSPRLFVFDLIRNNAELLRIDCGQYIGANETENLVVQMGPKLGCEQERHIYFVLGHHVPEILAYDILEQTWHRRSLTSHKFENMNQSFPIQPVDFTFGLQGELILAGEDGELYSTVERLEMDEEKDGIKLNHLGSLLGSSRSMIMDTSGTLYYVIPKFGAVVRCAQLENITAEGNEIIYLTSKNIQQIFFGFNGALWVLSDRVLKAQDMCFPRY